MLQGQYLAADNDVVPLNHEVTLPGGFVQVLAAAESLTDILTASAQWVPQIMGAHRGSVALPDGNRHLRIYALGSELVISPQVRLVLETSIVGKAFTSGRVINVTDLTTAPEDDAVTLRSAGLRSALICPLVSGGRSLGTINMANEAPHHFDAHDEILIRLIADLIASFLSVHQLAASEQALARTDPLTGCLNRRAILEHLDICFAEDERPPSVLYLDIDGFKIINDTHGHAYGDEILRMLQKRISGVVGTDDVLGRLGGDEFLIVVRNDRCGKKARATAERVSAVAAMPVAIRSMRLEAPISIGVASAEAESVTAADMLQDADQAMYAAKGEDHPIVVANEETRSHSIMVAAIDRDLDLGMKTNSITYHYQPIRDLRTREIVGAEALIRWNHWELGNIPAPLLIERLETTGKTDAFTRWSLRTIVAHWSRVHRELGWSKDRAVSMNLSPRQLAWAGYTDFHIATLKEFGFAPADVVVEVVESSAVLPGSAPEATLRKLCQHDVKIALDDFGTGHNALSYFTRFGIHGIKFDRSLVGAMHDNEMAKRILNGLSALATDLGVQSLAEGVETEIEAQLCLEADIALGQGWHFGRPGPLEGFIELAKTEQDQRLSGQVLHSVGVL